MSLETQPAAQVLTEDIPRPLNVARTKADRIYRALALSAGVMAFLIMGLIGLFLFLRAGPALKTAGIHFLFEKEWRPDSPSPVFGIAAVMFGTVVIAFIALTLAV